MATFSDFVALVYLKWLAKDTNMATAFSLVCSIAFLGLLCSAEGKYEAFSASAVPHEPILAVIEAPIERCMCFACFVLCPLHFKLHPVGLSANVEADRPV